MKKFLTIMTAAAVLLCGLVLTGCSGDNNPFLAPKETWFRREINYTTKSGQTTALYVYFAYSDNGFTPPNSNVALGPGLTVVVTLKDVTSSSSPISALVCSTVASTTTYKYYLKTFSNQANTEVGGDGDDADGTEHKSFKMSYAKWCWMYNLIRMDQQQGTITPLRDDSHFSRLTDFSQISWKKIMAEYLLDNLLN